MTKFEFDPSKLVVNDVDLSGYASNLDFSHCDDEAMGKASWGEYLAGLESASMSMTFDNSGGFFEPTGSLFFSQQQPKYRISYEVPDGKWQSFKHRLKTSKWSRFLFGWLRVRYVTYSFDAAVEQWQDEEGLTATTFRAEGTVTQGIEEHR